MTKKIISALTVIFYLGSLSMVTSCANVFANGANKTSDDAIFEDAQKLIDAKSWDAAITKLGELSVDGKAQVRSIDSLAGAYAGKCGLDFTQYINSLTNASLSGTETLFLYFMNAFTGIAVDPASCTTAQQTIELRGTLPTARTAGENLFMAILGMVKIGTYLRSLADVDGTGGLGDGQTDIPANGGTFRACNVGSISDSSVNEVITGMGLITSNLSYLTAVISSASVTGALATLNTACGATCSITDPTLVSNGDRTVMRALLRTSSANPTAPVGIEDCVDPAVAPCCP